MMPHMGLTMVACLVLAACASEAPAVPKPEPKPHTTHYICDDGTSFEAYFGVTDEVSITLLEEDRKIVLPQMRSGSGIRYEFRDYSLIGKGNEGLWKAGPDKAETRCDVKES